MLERQDMEFGVSRVTEAAADGAGRISLWTMAMVTSKECWALCKKLVGHTAGCVCLSLTTVTRWEWLT